MDRSLSLLMPLCDAQRWLWDAAVDMLDALPDISERLEIVLIDDGSRDDTPDIAAELSRRYPQVISIRHPAQSGRRTLVESGVRSSSGQIVMLHWPQQSPQSIHVERLLRRIDSAHVVLARIADQTAPNNIEIIRRSAIAPLQWTATEMPALLARLRQGDYVWDEIEIPAAKRNLTRQARYAGTRARQRVESPHETAGPRPIRPNFLDHFKAFALGE